MTEQRQRFCDKFIETLNATQSAIYAGYSEKSARSIASDLLNEDDVKEYLSEKRKLLQEFTGITTARVLDEYRKIAFSDIRKLYSDSGSVMPLSEIDDDTASAIGGLKSFEEYDRTGIFLGINKEVKLHDKLRALEALGKHLGLFDKDNAQLKAQITNVINLGSGSKPHEPTE